MIKKIVQPMVPTTQAGWHVRKKSDHFTHYQKISKEFCRLLGIDPWLISGTFRSMGEIDFSDPKSMTRLATKVDILLNEIRPKFQYYKISQKPYVFVKNDAGTYGMAVMNVESGEELLYLNKKQRQNMKVGKSGRRVSEGIIQEGIPTIDRFKGLIAEPVIYLIGHRMCGGFFRLHETKDERGNLNQPGMKFTKLCFHEMMGYSNEYKGTANLNDLSSVYKIIASLASFAAGCEIKKVREKTLISY
jgi:glutamate--cysteine ligase